jgi:CheY-like chemotaxis protein
MSAHRSTILVVEDDPDVREAAALILAERDHEVLTAANGAEALREIERTGTVDLLFTDIVMPGMDGFALARLAKERRPEIKVLYTTAFADRVQSEIGMLFGRVVPKPYRARVLQDEVDALLGAPPPENSGYWRGKARQFREAARLQSGIEAAVLERRADEFDAMAELMEEQPLSG